MCADPSLDYIHIYTYTVLFVLLYTCADTSVYSGEAGKAPKHAGGGKPDGSR